MANSDDEHDKNEAGPAEDELASFVVEFSVQPNETNEFGVSEMPRFTTRAHHMEEGTTQEWPGLATIELAHWLTRAATEKLSLPIERAAPSSIPLSAELWLKSNTRRKVDKPDLVSKGKVSRFLGLHFEGSELNICLKISGPRALDINSSEFPIPVGLYIHAYRMADNRFLDLGRYQCTFIPNRDFTVKHTFPSVDLPCGFYRLFGTAILYLESPMTVSSEGYLIQSL